jgi:6-pyruvoyl-tetrahydropterin synthase
VPIVVTQRIEWDMGHRLGDGYASKCRHAHGHFVVAFNTTVENIANWLGIQLQTVIDNDDTAKVRGVTLAKVRVYETPNGWAEWTKR